MIPIRRLDPVAKGVEAGAHVDLAIVDPGSDEAHHSDHSTTSEHPELDPEGSLLVARQRKIATKPQLEQGFTPLRDPIARGLEGGGELRREALRRGLEELELRLLSEQRVSRSRAWNSWWIN